MTYCGFFSWIEDSARSELNKLCEVQLLVIHWKYPTRGGGTNTLILDGLIMAHVDVVNLCSRVTPVLAAYKVVLEISLKP